MVRSDDHIWLDDLYELVDDGAVNEAIDKVFGHIDDLFLEGRFEEAGRLLLKADVHRLDTNLLVGLLCVAYPAQANGDLPSKCWGQLADKIRRRLEVLAPDRVERLMRGF